MDLIPKDYEWGSGYFREIAAIRRKVYTTHYTKEHQQLLEIILNKELSNSFFDKLLNEIENPLFFIDSKRYEEIKQYLWQRSLIEFEKDIKVWEKKHRVSVIRNSTNQIQCFEKHFLGFGSNKGTRSSLLLVSGFSVIDVSKPRGQVLDEMFLNDGNPYGFQCPIDFSNDIHERVVNHPQNITVVLGEVSNLVATLKWIEALLFHWQALSQGTKTRYKLNILVNKHLTPRNNNGVIQFNTYFRLLKELLAREDFKKLNKFLKSNILQIYPFNSLNEGMVLSELPKSVLNTIQKSNAIIVFGEQNLITVSGINLDAYFIFPIRDFSSIFFTGIKNDPNDSRYPKHSILYVPKGFYSAIDYTPDKRTILNCKEYANLFEKMNIEDIGKLTKRLKSKDKKVMKSALGLKDSVLGIVNLQKRRQMLQKKLALYGGSYIYYEKRADIYRKFVVHLLRFPKGELSRLKIDVLFRDQVKNYSGGNKVNITFNDLVREEPKAVVGFNFMYFITRALIDRFNRSSPHFRLSSDFFGEYIGFLKTDTKLFPALYNKGAVGWDGKGNFVFGRISMPSTGKVKIESGERSFVFEWSCINPKTIDDNTVILCTPFNKDYQSKQLKAGHSFGQKRSIFLTPDNHNYNFIIINDKCIGVIRESTEIPPFGVIISVPERYLSDEEKSYLDRFVDGMHNVRKNDNCKSVHGPIEVSPWKVSFDFILSKKWKDCKTIMGGGLLMVNKGKHEELVLEQSNGESVYNIEGWDLESSQRTQETPVETELREARSSIGLTSEDEIFISFIEGRANNRVGATHKETVEVVEALLNRQGKKIQYMLDLDSASSVSFGIIHSRQFLLLNQTARGSDSKIGDTRYQNHIAFIKPASKT